MVETVELGLSFRAEGDPARLAMLAEAVRPYSFDTLTVYDDLGDPPPFRTLVALAAACPTARVGPACVVVPRYASLESVVAEIVSLAQGRPGDVFLGLVAGAWLDELGLQRAGVSRMREALGVCRYLLDGRDDGFEGQHYTVRAGWKPLYALPASRVRLMLGAWGERMMALGGELADEVKVGASASAEIVTMARQRIGNDSVGVVLGAVTVVDEDGAAARRIARRRAVRYTPVTGTNDPVAREQFGDNLRQISEAMVRGDIETAEAALPDELLRRFAFAGTPEEVIRQAEDVFNGGASRIEFGSPHGLDEASGIRLLGERVLPYFRT
jgi:5,10-methylenetetrahydromethanopterin reductase